jgi:hypothetical protein
MDQSGTPVVTSALLPEDTICMVEGRIIVGTQPLSWAELAMRKLIRNRLADTYDWLGWKLPAIPPSGGAWGMLCNLFPGPDRPPVIPGSFPVRGP